MSRLFLSILLVLVVAGARAQSGQDEIESGGPAAPKDYNAETDKSRDYNEESDAPRDLEAPADEPNYYDEKAAKPRDYDEDEVIGEIVEPCPQEPCPQKKKKKKKKRDGGSIQPVPMPN